MTNSLNPWESLFKKSTFCGNKKNDNVEAFNPQFLLSFTDKDMLHFHDDRKNEYLIGRFCASKAFEKHFNQQLSSLPRNEDRSPKWPDGVIGSISHSSDWVGAAVSSSDQLLGIGLDFENMKRGKSELKRFILNDEDIKTHDSFSEEELIVLIFSAKESLYKALFPTVKTFFGFNAAAVRSLNDSTGLFKIDLISTISPEFGPGKNCHFEGRFKIFGSTCLTVIEIINLDNA